MSFDGLVSRKKVFYESSHRNETHLDAVLEVLEVKISFAFQFCIDEDFIYFWWSDLMFESPHDNNFHIIPTFQWWNPLVRRYHISGILSFLLIPVFWREFRKFYLIHHWCDHFCELFCEIIHFIIIILPVGLNCSLHVE